MKEVTITDYTKREIMYLAEMIHEKLIDMGHHNDGEFHFEITVSFEETKDE
jgi:hypothetical protein